LILTFRVPYARPHRRLIKPNRRHEVPTCPEVFSGEVTLLTAKLPCNRDGTLSLDAANDVCHRILRWNAQAHMHVVDHQVAFYHLALFLIREPPKNRPKVLAQWSIDDLLAPLGDKHYVVFAIPPCMAQTLVFSRDSCSYVSWSSVGASLRPPERSNP
jgi:hypothetical protein